MNNDAEFYILIMIVLHLLLFFVFFNTLFYYLIIKLDVWLLFFYSNEVLQLDLNSSQLQGVIYIFHFKDFNLFRWVKYFFSIFLEYFKLCSISHLLFENFFYSNFLGYDHKNLFSLDFSFHLILDSKISLILRMHSSINY